eukprot:TRINITY_DN2586_c0_g3_i1.p1 TRINITY_DN2586_c0_g3~~TRINITY_DN2586_c0_g3_i1.p1  ORF type:complete len:190 (-),score=42.01 TRINITY_DN2586_c0_g3_i1:757-1326(-)
MVATVDWPCVNKYATRVRSQAKRQEIIQDVYSTSEGPDGRLVAGGMAIELLQEFIRAVGEPPQRIILYRDGVSEGQFQHVLAGELAALRQACRSLRFSAKITFVVVNKRHHTRMFPDKGPDAKKDNSGNVMPGTVVDLQICHPTEFDFYLCSHAGIQGTSRPAHYHVLFDENEMTSDEMQSLTNNLCYT